VDDLAPRQGAALVFAHSARQIGGLRAEWVAMEAELIKTFRFDAAHTLPCVPEGHKCSRMHGHSYRVDIHVVGAVDLGGAG